MDVYKKGNTPQTSILRDFLKDQRENAHFFILKQPQQAFFLSCMGAVTFIPTLAFLTLKPNKWKEKCSRERN